MDPATSQLINEAVRDCVKDLGPTVPAWIKWALTVIGIQTTTILGKFGVDLYRVKKAESELVRTPSGMIPERRRYNAARCDEHISRIHAAENAIQAVKPDIARLEEKLSGFFDRLERGDDKFDRLSESIAQFATSTAVLSKQVERLEKTIDKWGDRQ